MVRPEALSLVAAGTAGALTGRVVERRYAGPVTYYQVELTGAGLEIEVAAGAGVAAIGDEVAVAPGAAKDRAAGATDATDAAGAAGTAGRIFRRAPVRGPA